MPENEKVVKNHDILGLYNRLNRFIYEIQKCNSADVAEVQSFDQTRMQQMITALNAYIDFIVKEPAIDLRETAPFNWSLEAAVELVDTENENVNDFCRLMKVMRDEVINCTSARQPCGMAAFDKVRQQALVQKLSNLLNDYIKNATPIDLAESIPMNPSVGPGKTGV